MTDPEYIVVLDWRLNGGEGVSVLMDEDGRGLVFPSIAEAWAAVEGHTAEEVSMIVALEGA